MFGEGVSISQQIQHMIDTSPKLKITDAQLMMLDVYESGFGIYNHNIDSERPLALVAMHWSEDNTTQSALHERIEQFHERNVYQAFGLNLTEFLELPRDVCIKILDICGKKQSREDRVAQDLQQQFNKLGRQP